MALYKSPLTIAWAFFHFSQIGAACAIPGPCMPKEGPAFLTLPDTLDGVVGDIGIYADYVKGLPGTNQEDNAGGFINLNLAFPLPNSFCHSFGFQIGGSYGVYEIQGANFYPSYSQRKVNEQLFATAGLFYKSAHDYGLNAAVVYDWMYNRNLSSLDLTLQLFQVRYELSYLTCCTDEVGVWGTTHANSRKKHTLDCDVAFRAFDQVSIFWRHLFNNCCETKIWAGIPYRDDDRFTNRGRFLVGGNFYAPLPCNWSIEGHGMYLQTYDCQSGNKIHYAFNLALGVNYAFGGSDCCKKPDDFCSFRAYLPVANNSNFITNAASTPAALRI